MALGRSHATRRQREETGEAAFGIALNPRGIPLTWGKKAFADRPREIVLRVEGGPQLVWRYSNVAGLVRGVNQLLLTARSRERFIELSSDGDYHLFVFGTDDVERRMANSPLFRMHHEPDRVAQPAR